MKKHCLLVNKKGLGSLYALSLLFVVSVYVTCSLSQTFIFLQAQTADRSFHQAQLFAIYHVKAMLLERTIIKDTDTPKTSQPVFSIEQETLPFQSYMVSFTYSNKAVVVQINTLQFELSCDMDKKEILDLAYLS